MKQARSILTCLVLLSSLAFSAFAEKAVEVASIDFEKGEDLSFLTKWGALKNEVEVVDGRKVLHASSMGCGNNYNAILNVPLSSSGIYKVTFEYRYNARGSDGSFLFTSFVSKKNAWVNSAAGLSEFPAEIGAFKNGVVTAILLPTFDDYVFTMAVMGKVDVTVGNIKIVRIEDPQFLLNKSTASTPNANETASVRGAREFTVELPEAAGEAPIVSVNDYGASPASANNTDAFRKAIAHCAAVKAAKLTVSPGVYRFVGNAGILRFSGLRDFTFDGQGAEFRYSVDNDSVKTNFIEIDDCQRVHFKNFTIDWDYEKIPLLGHGRIAAIHDDRKGIDMSLVDYRATEKKNRSVQMLRFFDGETMNPASGGPMFLHEDIKNAKQEWINDNTIRLKFSKELPSCAVVGQHYVVAFALWGGAALNMRSISQGTFETINIYASQGFGIFSALSDNIRIAGCKIIKRPGENRVLGTNSDGLDIINQREGNFLIENCEFSYSGDDFINLNNTVCLGMRSSQDPRRLTVKTNWPDGSGFRIGSWISVRKRDYSPTGYEAKILEKQPGNKEVILTMDKDIPSDLPEDAIVLLGTGQTQNYIIRNNFFHHGFCRGILPNAKNGLIENNRFLGNAKSDLLIYTDKTLPINGEGSGIENLIIRNNTFEDSNVKVLGETAASILISMYAPGKVWFPIQRDILIYGNKFINPNGSILFCNAVHNLSFNNNTIKIDSSYGSKNLPVHPGNIFIGSYSDNISIKKNFWETPTAEEDFGIWIFPNDVGAVSILDNQRKIKNQGGK